MAAENAWGTYCDADCRSHSDLYLGGTVQPAVYVSCLASRDTSRRHELATFYKTLTHGRTKAPKLP